MKNAARTRIGEGGRIVIPSSFRKNLKIDTGDEVVISLDSNIISITTPKYSLSQLQNGVKSSMKGQSKTSLVDELISMRRADASKE
jgi:AbrB family looped-hinge helix DNA binding protein